MSKYRDLTGQKFGRLTCLKFVGRNKGYDALWLCKCDCGSEHITRAGTLLNGHTKSCGCYQRDRTGESHTVHGLYFGEDGKRSRLYHVWGAMKRRCLAPNATHFADYGGRGIAVCQEWMNFRPFYDWAMANGYKYGLTIERINVDGNYEPANCTWIPKSEQAQNRRYCKYITYMGKTMIVKKWADFLGIKPKVLELRLRRGWSIEKAFNKPVRRLKKSAIN